MLCPWLRLVTLAPLLLAAAGTPSSQVPHESLQALDGGLPHGASKEALLRTESASITRRPSDGEEMAAVISSQGIKYISPHRKSHPPRHAEPPHPSRGHTAAVGGVRDHAVMLEAIAPNLSAVAVKNATGVHNNMTSGALGSKANPNTLYFGIGLGTFLVALFLMAVAIGKMDYLQTQDLPGQAPEGNPQGEDEPGRQGSHATATPVHPGFLVEYRMQHVLVAWLFIVASVAYFLDFLSLQVGLWKLRHWFGVVASLLWLFGFLLHLHWQLTVGSNRIQLTASFFKVMACVFGQIHPFSMIMGGKETDAWVWWPSLAGIASWHIGNMIVCIDHHYIPPSGTEPNGGIMAHGNLQVTEMWVDLVATSLLTIASMAVTQWKGQPELQWVATKNWAVLFGQFGGCLFFLLGGIVHCEWCNGFRNCSHYPEEAAGSVPGS